MRSRLGSSPLTRGKLDGHVAHLDGDRLIPAHAGKTPSMRAMTLLRRAHPRSRRENLLRLSRGSRAGGSSPLMRGKPAHEKHLIAPGGLIPAHAGKTQRIVAPGSREPAHPRSRGENEPAPLRRGIALGSSPLTRGKLKKAKLSGAASQLIPAHAGKTASSTSESVRFPAHPRSRGENIRQLVHFFGGNGSSPLTRGKLFSRRWPP